MACEYPSEFLVYGLVTLVALALFIWWTKEKALMSFRAWALFIAIVHALYFCLVCNHIREILGLTMADIFFVRGIEMLVTFITLLRLYFIIEAYGIDITNNSIDVNPIQKITSSVQRAVVAPENPEKINGNTKKTVKKSKKSLSLRERLLKLLF